MVGPTEGRGSAVRGIPQEYSSISRFKGYQNGSCFSISRFPGYQNITLTVLVVGPESVSYYERSHRETAVRFNHFSVRVFFEIISKSQPSMIYCIFVFFRIHIPKMDSFPMLFSHPTRPPAGPCSPYNIF